MDPHEGTGRIVLPTNVKPTHYDLTLSPDLVNFVFSGHLLVNLDILQPTTEITLNTKELEIQTAKLTNLALKTESNQTASKILYDASSERATIVFPDQLQSGTKAVLTLAFTGFLNESMNGFYRSSYVVDGVTHYLATTQFEATDARKAFPCWDEPAIKATFDITLRVASDMTALSNMNIISDKEIGQSGKVKGDSTKGPEAAAGTESLTGAQKGDTFGAQKGDSFGAQKGDSFGAQKGDSFGAQKGDNVAGGVKTLKEVKFATTPIMSTYLVAFIVGKFDYIETVTDSNIVCRVYVSPGKASQAEFALTVVPKAIDYFTELFGAPYPLPKMDLVTIPDFESGAMENWGLITYREIRLLFDEKTSDLSYKRHIAYTIFHETAHMWFGNLVTMDWWDFLWLNEGFATWVGNLGVSKFFPEWDNWPLFIADGFQMGLGLDGLRSSHPVEVPCKHSNEIQQIFDAISYYKGASCIRMLHAWLGEDLFLTGIRAYIKKHAYGNTTSKDLWAALSDASGKDVGGFMRNWIEKVGYPVVSSEENDDASELTLTQSRFLASGDLQVEEDTTRWNVPLGVEPIAKSSQDLLTGDSIKIQLSEKGHYKVNSGYNGFFRTAHSISALERFGKLIRAQDSLFTSSDRVGLLADAGALSKSGHIKTSSLLTLLEAFDKEEEYVVWITISDRLGVLKSAFYQQPEDVLAGLQKFERKLFGKAATKYGWDQKEGDSYGATLLRKMVLTNAGTAGDEDVIAEARKRFAQYLQGDAKALNQNVQSAAFEVVVSNGDKQDFENVLQCWRQAKTTDQKLAAIGAFCTVKDSKLAQTVLDVAISKEVKNQDVNYFFAGLSRNSATRHQLWEFLKENWDTLAKRYQGSNALLGNIVKAGIGRFSSVAMADEAEAFFKTKEVDGVKRAIGQSLEIIRSNAAWVERDAEDVRQWLDAHGYLN